VAGRGILLRNLYDPHTAEGVRGRPLEVQIVPGVACPGTVRSPRLATGERSCSRMGSRQHVCFETNDKVWQTDETPR
jgi:hypothetical protein